MLFAVKKKYFSLEQYLWQDEVYRLVHVSIGSY
jgi:hypothetical protein